MNKVLDNGNGTYSFYCPGCRHHHVYFVALQSYNGSQWSFNGSLENPSFTPSLLNRWGKEAWAEWEEPLEPAPYGGWSGRCHLFVTDGKIHYCGDCTHEFKGQTVEMQEALS